MLTKLLLYLLPFTSALPAPQIRGDEPTPAPQSVSLTVNPIVTSMNKAASDLSRLVAEANVFTGSGIDLEAFRREFRGEFDTLDEIATAITAGAQFNDVDSIAIVAAVPRILNQTHELSLAMVRRPDDNRSTAFLRDGSDVSYTVSQSSINLVEAVFSRITPPQQTVLRDVSKLLLNQIRNINDAFVAAEGPQINTPSPGPDDEDDSPQAAAPQSFPPVAFEPSPEYIPAQ